MSINLQTVVVGENRKTIRYSFYNKFIKRVMDIILSLLAIILLSPFMLIIYFLVKIKLGSPVIFVQERPGKDMEICKYHKFRTMTDAKDSNGNLLSDEERLTAFGKKLRSTSLDELPQLFDILSGKMSIVGPRPQTVENVMFMSKYQKQRHLITPGLTGWAQVNGRNNVTWDSRINYDLEYVEKCSFLFDLKIILKTVTMVICRKDISQEGFSETFETMGEYLLRTDQISKEQYEKKIGSYKKLV